MKLLNKLERKFGKFAIKNLMGYIVFANAAVYLLFMFNPPIINNLVLYPSRVLSGEVWRLITFLFIPPTTTKFVLFVIFALYIDYLIGSSLEQQWGTFKFNIYYLVGVIGTIIGAFLTGVPMDNYYLNISLFFAFTKLFPDFQFVLFFILPVKVKYLGWIAWGFFVFNFVIGSTSVRVAIIAAIINYILFFGKETLTGRKQATSAHIRKKAYKTNMSPQKEHLHQCEVCKKTDQVDVNLEFRHCSKCEGQHEYCMEHLFTHEHIK